MTPSALPGSFVLSQRRFTNLGVDQKDLTWQVPLTLKFEHDGKVESRNLLLDAPEQTVDLGKNVTWIYPNQDAYGYFRWNVSPEMMKELSKVGIFFNFTWDELSPLLGVDPQIMYNTIREVGPEHFTLSSDAGEPLFPDSVEAMRLVRGYMEAFGLNQDELYTVCTKNPAKVVGLALD